MTRDDQTTHLLLLVFANARIGMGYFYRSLTRPNLREKRNDRPTTGRFFSPLFFATRSKVYVANNKMLNLPPPKEFLWQYVHSTPLTRIAVEVDKDVLAALEREVVEAWQDFEEDGALMYQQRIVVASARK